MVQQLCVCNNRFASAINKHQGQEMRKDGKNSFGKYTNVHYLFIINEDTLKVCGG
jgi:hypothetical protein